MCFTKGLTGTEVLQRRYKQLRGDLHPFVVGLVGGVRELSEVWPPGDLPATFGAVVSCYLKKKNVKVISM